MALYKSIYLLTDVNILDGSDSAQIFISESEPNFGFPHTANLFTLSQYTDPTKPIYYLQTWVDYTKIF